MLVDSEAWGPFARHWQQQMRADRLVNCRSRSLGNDRPACPRPELNKKEPQENHDSEHGKGLAHKSLLLLLARQRPRMTRRVDFANLKLKSKE